MAEHPWIQEHLETYLAGGLDAAERERFEQHVANCAACAQALTAARAMDSALENLFANSRPTPVLEDRMIASVRAMPLPLPPRVALALRLAAVAAGLLILGAFGDFFSGFVADGTLPFPGQPQPTGSLARRNTTATAPPRIFDGLFSAPQATPEGVDRSDSRVPPESSETAKLESRRSENFQHKSEMGQNYFAKRADKLDDGKSREALKELSDDTNGRAGWQDSDGLKPMMGGGLDAGGEKSFGLSSRPAPQTDSMRSSGSATTLGLSFQPPVKFTEQPGGTLNKAGKDSQVMLGSQTRSLSEVYTYKDDRKLAGAPAATAPNAAPEKAAEISNGVAGVGDAESEKRKERVVEQAVSSREPGQKPGASNIPAKASAPSEPKPESPTALSRKIIRTGEIEFEIESFDAAVATIARLINDLSGGFIATVNSEKLANGKVRGSVVVRVPPERLDNLVLDLRRELGKGGELKGQRIGSQDITKQYTDLESRLRAARAMEERLLQIIKSGKGEIKDLLATEKELGVWRTRIEEFEGELRYYANQVALSTLTITLYEKEIRAPFAVVETERIQMGLEVEDVEKAHRQALAAVVQAKGRITKSEMKQHEAGKFTAQLHFEVAPEAAGPLRDRLKQLGTVSRLEVERVLQSEGGTGRAAETKSKQNDAQFFLSIYNLANVGPRETVHVNLACLDTEAAYKSLVARVEKASGRVLASNLNRLKADQTTGTVQFEIRSAEADAVLVDIKEAGEVMKLQITENADGNATRSKRGFNIQLWSMAQVAPRETTTLQVATRDVPASYRALQEAIAKAKGRVLTAQLNERDKENIQAQLDFEMRRTEEAALTTALDATGDVFTRSVSRAPENENTVDSKVRIQVSLLNAAHIPPRETVSLGLETHDVEKTAAALSAWVQESKGRTAGSHISHEANGRTTANLTFDVPLAAAAGLVERFKTVGIVRTQKSSRNPQVPEGSLATARIEVLIANAELIVPSDEGLWPRIRTGLSYSATALSWSLSWVIFGLCVVLPWALVAYGGYRLVQRLRPRAPATTTPA